MDRQFAAEAIAARGGELLLQTAAVAQVGEYPIDCLYAERGGRQQATAARQLKGEGERAVGVAAAAGAEGRGEILRSPGEAGETRGGGRGGQRLRILRQRQQALGGLGGNDEQPHAERGDATLLFECGEPLADRTDLRGRGNLRQHQARGGGNAE